MDEDKSLYLLQLTRARAAMISVAVLALLALFFFVGLAVGVKAGGATPAQAAAPATPPDSALVDLGSDAEPPLAATTPSNASSARLPFKASVTRPPVTETPLPSSVLAAADQARPAKSGSHPAAAAKPEPSKPNGDHWYVQVNATSDKAKAERAVKALAEKGAKSYLKSKVDAAGKTVWMVRVGPYSDRSRALKDLAGFRDKGYKDSYMVILKGGKTDSPATDLAGL